MQNFSANIAAGVDASGSPFSLSSGDMSRSMVYCRPDLRRAFFEKVSSELLLNGFNVVFMDSEGYSDKIELINSQKFFEYNIFDFGRNLFIPNFNAVPSDFFISSCGLGSCDFAPVLKKAFDSCGEKTFQNLFEAADRLKSGACVREDSFLAARAGRFLSLSGDIYGGYFRPFGSEAFFNSIDFSNSKLIVVNLSKDNVLDNFLLYHILERLPQDEKLFLIFNSNSDGFFPALLEKLFSKKFNFLMFSEGEKKNDNGRFSLEVEEFGGALIASFGPFKKKFFLKP